MPKMHIGLAPEYQVASSLHPAVYTAKNPAGICMQRGKIIMDGQGATYTYTPCLKKKHPRRF